MSIRTMMKYDLARIPYDLLSLADKEPVKNWSALVICTIIFWGGTLGVLSILYAADNVKDYIVMTVAWLVFCIVNMVAQVEWPGLFYCDPVDWSRLSRIWLIALGPIGTIRMLALWVFLGMRVVDRHTSVSTLISTNVSTWPENNSWQRTIKRQLEVPVVPFRAKCRETLNSLWKIANKRIEIL